MLTVLNQALLESGRRHRFVTLVIGSVRRAEHGRVRITLATGGHPPPLVLRIDGTVDTVAVSGTLIGAVPQTVVRPATVELAPGELCLLYSDGLFEARGGATGTEQYGEQRLRDALASCQGMTAETAVERVRQLVSDWLHGGVRDDIAMLAVRAPARTRLSLTGGPARSPFAIDDAPRTARKRA
jgi:serine phosphatase RsbU (regulator of sigma subunit)